MPTALTVRLTRAHDAQQRQLAEQLAQLLRTRWGTTVRRPGVGTDQFLDQAVRSIRAQYRMSASLARGYYTQARRLEFPGEPRETFDLPTLEEEAVVTSIVAAGFQELSDALKRGDTLEEALERSGTTATGAGVRHGLNGGRQFLIDATRNDRLDVGYARVPKEGCCSFCAMLASRMVVYRDESFAESDARFIGPGEVKVHDACRCEFRPIWRRGDAEGLDANRSYQQLWKDVTAPFSGHDKALAFRRAYEERYLRGVRREQAA